MLEWKEGEGIFKAFCIRELNQLWQRTVRFVFGLTVFCCWGDLLMLDLLSRGRQGLEPLYTDLGQFQLSLCIAWGWVLRHPLNVPCCLTTYWQGESPKLAPQVLQVSRGPRGGMCFRCYSCKHRHRELEMERHPDQHLPQKGIPLLVGHEGRGSCWKGEGEPPSAGKLWGKHLFLCRPSTQVLFSCGGDALWQQPSLSSFCQKGLSLCRLENAWNFHKSFLRSSVCYYSVAWHHSPSYTLIKTHIKTPLVSHK